uniref:Milk gland protein 6 n=1 Tax=Glossina brevipalpis TaxID=37001 RepID=A0A3F2Z3G6_9MUSC
MKFFALFVVATLALSVSAGTLELREKHNQINLEHNIKESSNDFAVFFKSFYEFFNKIFLHFFKGFFENFGQFFPAQLTEAFMNIFQHWPAFDKVFPKEFFYAFEEFVHTLGEYFSMPHHFFAIFENTFKSFPGFTEFLPAEFLPTLGKYLERVPYCREFLQQWYMIMQQLTAHSRQL